jgi:ribonuclease P protein component
VTPRLRLPRAARIHEERTFQALRAAPRVRGRWFMVAAVPNGLERSRLAVRVAKKVMRSAVARNRVRRSVKETFRLQRAALAPADFLVSLVRPYCEQTLHPAREEVGRLLLQASRR